jgi:hypothetical protein
VVEPDGQSGSPSAAARAAYLARGRAALDGELEHGRVATLLICGVLLFSTRS